MTFSVVAMVKPSAAELYRFANHYIDIGAERVYAFFDGGRADLDAREIDASMLPAGTEVIALDDEFWNARGIQRPDEFIKRRREVHAYGKHLCTSKWLFICDEDEFIIERHPIHEALATIPEHVISVRLPVAEAVWGPGDDLGEAFGSTWFRRPWPVALDRRRVRLLVYGPFGGFFSRGVLGHISGKQFVRTDAFIDELGTHVSSVNGENVSVWGDEISPEMGALELAHFDAISFDRWIRKFRARAHDPSIREITKKTRQRQTDLVNHLVGQRRWLAWRLFAHFYGLSTRQARFLERRGLAFREIVFKA
ncbi:hypothetical protein P6F26_14385 [Roseibacterium sp. SDUM158017]|uniref:hypothetical protein n=1 Tax=Roseicyclus salinarum TaxID=3036773 RepID=UPI002414DE10|nr:hypothetical protein [Roseibacterium sp. SDUM158017]MDG4649629.1 hypothetical protein [Roseibacterium sp. SDUM158017]